MEDKYNGFGILEVIAVTILLWLLIFIGLKLFNMVYWTWWTVFIPLYVFIAYIGVLWGIAWYQIPEPNDNDF